MKLAVVALIIKDGYILGISRREDKTKYGLIGGKVDAKSNESLEEALLREVKEETSLEVNSYIKIYNRIEYGSDGIDFYTTCYYIPSWSGTLSNSDEGECIWLTKEEIILTKAAFGEYNQKTLSAFKEMFPNVYNQLH